MKKLFIIIAILLASMALPSSAHAALLTEVQFQSPYVFVLGGYDNEVTYSEGDINSLLFYVRDETNDGFVDVLSVRGDGETADLFSDTYWNFNFSTKELGNNIKKEKYLDVDRFPFENAGHAGFAAGISGVGIDSELPFIYGEFEILDFKYDYEAGSVVPNVPDPKVLSFASNFKLYNTRDEFDVLTGHIYYNYDPNQSNVVPEPATMAMLITGLFGGAFSRRRKQI